MCIVHMFLNADIVVFEPITVHGLLASSNFWYTSCTRMFRFCSWRLWHPLYSYTTVTTGTELFWFHSCFLSPPRFLGFSSSGHALWSNPGTVFATASGHPVVLRPGRPSQDLPQEVRWYNLGSPLVVVCLEMPSRWYICNVLQNTQNN